jgi:hypothetical protein
MGRRTPVHPESCRTVRSEVVNLNAGSGTAHDGPYIASSMGSGRAALEGVPLERARGRRVDPLGPEVGRHLAHQVELANFDVSSMKP